MADILPIPTPPTPTPPPTPTAFDLLGQLLGKLQLPNLNTKWLLIAVVVAGGWIYYNRDKAPSPAPSPFGPSPVSPFGPSPTPSPVAVVAPQAFLQQLYSVTSTSPQSPLYCRYYADLFNAAATQLEADGRQPVPVVKSREQALAFISRIGQLEQSVVPKGSLPGLSPILLNTFSDGFPKTGGPLLPEDRSLAVTKLRTIGSGFSTMADYYRKSPPKPVGPTF